MEIKAFMDGNEVIGGPGREESQDAMIAETITDPDTERGCG